MFRAQPQRPMNVLFVHNNFPAQFKHVAARLKRSGSGQYGGDRLGDRRPSVEGVDLRRYPAQGAKPRFTPSPADSRSECRRAEQVMFSALKLKSEGFEPDLMIGHCGWGETLPLRSVFPEARMAVYCEFFYRAEGQDVGFDLETGQFGVDGLVGLSAKNANSLIALADCDVGISPTPWQRSTFPARIPAQDPCRARGRRHRLARARSRPRSSSCPGGPRLDRQDEVVTYFARGLEPMRGFHVFMRAVPEILRLRPNAQIVIVGARGILLRQSAAATAASGSIIACARRCRRSISRASISWSACRMRACAR